MGPILNTCDSINGGEDSMSFIESQFPATGYVRDRFACWKFYICNKQVKSSFGCNVGSVTAPNIHLDWYSAQENSSDAVVEMDG